MHEVYRKIAQAIEEDRVLFSIHADNQLASRDIVRWQVVAGFREGALLEVLPQAKPYPKILRQQTLADGTEVVVVWSYIESLQSANVVTVFFPEE